MLLQFIISLLMCVFLVQSQTNDKAYTVSVPIRHSLPDHRTVSKFGSSKNGNCSQIRHSSEHSDIHRGGVCDGTSVLNDGIIPALSEVGNDRSLWAAELLTMRQMNTRIVLSFEVKNDFYDCMELAMFNCPERDMNASRVNIYRDTSFRPERQTDSLGINIASYSLSDTSCDYLLKFYVNIMSEVNSSYYNIEFPLLQQNYVFIGELSFLTGADDCEQWPPKLIKETNYLQNSTWLTDELTSTTESNITSYPPSTKSTVPTPQNSQATLTTVIAAAVVVVLIVLMVVFFMIVCVCLRNHKRKKVPLKIDDTGCVEDSMTETNKESETKFTNSVHKAASVNSEQLMSVTSSIPVLDGIYSNPDEVGNVATTSFTERKSPYRAIDQQQTRRNHYSPADNAILSTRHSFTPVTSTGLDDLEGVTYSVPNKEKRKTRQSLASNVLSRAEFEARTEGLLQEDSDNKVYESVDPVPPSYHNGSNNNLLDPSNSGNDQPAVTNSDVQQLSCSEEAEGILDIDAIYAEPLDPSSTNKPEWDPDQDKYESDTCTKQPIVTTSDVQQLLHSEEGILDPDAIYAEPLNPSSTNKPLEWDPDQSIYESVYSESLKPSLFMQEAPTECQEEVIESEDLYPYSSIYTVPDADLTNKPLLVSAQNIKVLKHLGNGNFGEVVLAQTVDLTPQQLQIESQAPFALVAVKRLKASASEATKELFDKEVKFMSRLNHPNVVRMLAVCTDKENPFIMMEYMMSGDLHQYLKRFKLIGEGTYENVKFISISTLTNISLQIASAMQYLASHNFVHRDLATRNCLVGSKNTVKISDFGMSRSLYESHYYIISGHAILPIRWMATECFYGKFSAKTDVWALGVTMWEIFTLAKEQPYNHLQDMEVVEDAIKGPDRTLLEQPAKCPQDVYDVMKACWVYDPAQRPTFDALYDMLSKI